MTVFDQDDTDEDASIEEQIEDAEDIDRSTQASFSSDYKVLGEKDAPGGAGVVGHNTASSGSSYGVEGATDADADAGNGLIPAGVRGAADGAGVVRGVFGEADTKSGRGVVGTANKNSGVQNATLQRYPAGVFG